MPRIYDDLGFEKIEELPDGFWDDLKNISRDLPADCRAASLFQDYFGNHGLRDIVNAWCREQAELETWVFDYQWAKRAQTRNRKREAQTVVCFRSGLIQFPTLVAMPGAFIKWPDFVTNLFPALIKEDAFPAYPKLRYTCEFFGDAHQSHRRLLTDDVLSFLEERQELMPDVAFSRPLPPGFETCGNRMTFYRSHTVIASDRFESFLQEAEQLLKLLTLAV